MKKIALVVLGIVLLIGAWLLLSQPTSHQLTATAHWPLTWEATPQEITARCKQASKTLQTEVDKLSKTPLDEVTWQSLEKLEDILADNHFVTSRLSFYSSVYPDKAQRDASQECSKQNSKQFVDLFTREDLFKIISKAASLAPDSTAQQILAQDYVRAFKKNGLHLSAEKRQELVDIRKRIIDLASEYRERLNNWSDPIWVSASQLAGMPDSFVKNLEQKDDKYKLTLKYPHYYPFMEMATHAPTRRQLEEHFARRGGERNRDIFQEVLVLRYQAATILGYPTHAHTVLEDRMAGDPDSVETFLRTLAEKLRPRVESDIAAMVALKRAELGDETISHLDPWDWRYYAHQITKQQYSVDHEKLSEYFPLNRVLAGMFETYETLFDLKFIEVIDAPKWHPSVKAYAVKEGNSNEPRAYFYMDLYPREGKYGHAAAFTLISGRKLKDDTYQKPVASIVANFTPPTASAPSLLQHSEVETLFHEFGHIMHQVLTSAEYDSQSGTSVKRDFVEAPSQMLENWIWRKESLAKLSSHYQTGEPIPDDTLERLLDSRNANSGLLYSRQIFLASVDQAYHGITSAEKPDTTKLWRELQPEIMMVGIPENTYPEASFNHLIGGYDAGYYGYLWSEVFAQDMFTAFDENGLFDTETGKRYLELVLKPGGSRDPNDLLKNFLGREPNQDAFLESLGLRDQQP